jgi:hypothetical protein
MKGAHSKGFFSRRNPETCGLRIFVREFRLKNKLILFRFTTALTRSSTNHCGRISHRPGAQVSVFGLWWRAYLELRSFGRVLVSSGVGHLREDPLSPPRVEPSCSPIAYFFTFCSCFGLCTAISPGSVSFFHSITLSARARWRVYTTVRLNNESVRCNRKRTFDSFVSCVRNHSIGRPKLCSRAHGSS